MSQKEQFHWGRPTVGFHMFDPFSFSEIYVFFSKYDPCAHGCSMLLLLLDGGEKESARMPWLKRAHFKLVLDIFHIARVLF